MLQRKGSSVGHSPRVRRANNKDRQLAASRVFEAKVCALQEFADRRKPLIAGLPTSMRQFRAWTNADLGLVPIGSSTTTDPNVSPHNGKLIELAYEAMRVIAKLQATKKLRVYVPRASKIVEQEDAIEQLRERNRRLASEALELLHKLELERRLRGQLESERDAARDDLQNLRRQFIELTSPGPRRVK